MPKGFELGMRRGEIERLQNELRVARRRVAELEQHFAALGQSHVPQSGVPRNHDGDERFRRLVESNIIGVILSRIDGRIEEANDAFLKIVGFSRDDLAEGRVNWRNISPPEYDEVNERAVRQVLEHGTAGPLEKEYIRRDGRRVPVLVGLARIESMDANIAFVLDLTEQKRAEAQLKESASELARSNTDLKQFAYIVSHDLQEPLRMINGSLQLLQKRHEHTLDTDALRLIHQAIEGTVGMQALIMDLLEYSSVDVAGHTEEPADANTAFDSAVANLASQIEDTGADVARELLPTTCRVDRIQLTQVYQNLLSNAIKFRTPGCRPRIRARARCANGEWVFSVKDNGIGIDRHQTDRIFTIFQRLHPRTVYAGTGIGLAIAQKIVERHGGRIWVESNRGRGSTFFFTLPA